MTAETTVTEELTTASEETTEVSTAATLVELFPTLVTESTTVPPVADSIDLAVTEKPGKPGKHHLAKTFQADPKEQPKPTVKFEIVRTTVTEEGLTTPTTTVKGTTEEAVSETEQLTTHGVRTTVAEGVEEVTTTESKVTTIEEEEKTVTPVETEDFDLVKTSPTETTTVETTTEEQLTTQGPSKKPVRTIFKQYLSNIFRNFPRDGKIWWRG